MANRSSFSSFLVACGLVACGVACGGATATVPDPSSSSGASGGASSGGGSSGAGASSGASSGGDRACTAMGCSNGFDVSFSYSQPGTYVVTVKLDGEEIVCKASIPLRDTTDGPCGRSDVLLTTVGSMLPVAQQSIGGLHITTTSPKRLSVQVQRDEKMLATGAWDPIPLVTRPGPNGPGCEPETCTSGSVNLLER